RVAAALALALARVQAAAHVRVGVEQERRVDVDLERGLRAVLPDRSRREAAESGQRQLLGKVPPRPLRPWLLQGVSSLFVFFPQDGWPQVQLPPGPLDACFTQASLQYFRPPRSIVPSHVHGA